jgi:hypothetical protein
MEQTCNQRRHELSGGEAVVAAVLLPVNSFLLTFKSKKVVLSEIIL